MLIGKVLNNIIVKTVVQESMHSIFTILTIDMVQIYLDYVLPKT